MNRSQSDRFAWLRSGPRRKSLRMVQRAIRDGWFDHASQKNRAELAGVLGELADDTSLTPRELCCLQRVLLECQADNMTQALIGA
jgi:hypothetical protein